jgi:hypothetical protein
MSGSTSTFNEFGSYGDKGVPWPANVPGGREGGIGWRDSDGKFLVVWRLGL